MDINELEKILTTASGLNICPVCHTPFKKRHSRQKTCGNPECRRIAHNEYTKEYNRRLRKEKPELYKERRRISMRKTRQKQRELIRREEELKRLGDKWERVQDFEDKVKKFGINYGEMQKRKTLESVPKIDVNIGEKNGDKNNMEK